MDTITDDDDFDVPGLPKRRKKVVKPKVVEPAVTASRASMADDEAGAHRSLTTVIATSALTSALVTLGVVLALGRARPAMLATDVSAIAARHAAPRDATATSAIAVPDLARIPAENVRAIVEAMGLRVIVNERREPSEIAAGLVAAQAPRAGTRLARGADIAVVISSGPAPAAPIAPSIAAAPAADSALITVPSVYRLRAREVGARLSAAGLTLGSQRRGGYDEDMSPGRVLNQSPAAGARVARGTRVNIWLNAE